MRPNGYNIENRPKDKVHRVNFRCDDIHKIILASAMEEYDVGKSEILRRIIVEWNMLRYEE
jgi:hypothetical protein